MLLIRTLEGKTILLPVTSSDTVATVQAQLQERTRVTGTWLLHASRRLNMQRTLTACGIVDGSTLTESCGLAGGKPVKVDVLTNSGTTVLIDIESNTPMHEVKRQLQGATGIPIAHQKVMLEGIGKMVVADKRTNIGFSHCGSTNNLYFATLGTSSASGSSK